MHTTTDRRFIAVRTDLNTDAVRAGLAACCPSRADLEEDLDHWTDWEHLLAFLGMTYTQIDFFDPEPVGHVRFECSDYDLDFYNRDGAIVELDPPLVPTTH